MTTNTEHRRRETDKIDQVCIKYQLEKANARIAEQDNIIYALNSYINTLHAVQKRIDPDFKTMIGVVDKIDSILPLAEANNSLKHSAFHAFCAADEIIYEYASNIDINCDYELANELMCILNRLRELLTTEMPTNRNQGNLK